jgi:hypothetical protein
MDSRTTAYAMAMHLALRFALLVPPAKLMIGYNPLRRATYIKHDRPTRQGGDAMDVGPTEFIAEDSEEVRVALSRVLRRLIAR